ncbi:methionyl-tRNA formyltransferase [Calditerricola yamamurae]
MGARIVFMGTPDFAVPSLEGLLAAGYDVVAVVTQPDRPKGRKQILTPPPVKVRAQAAGIPVLQPQKLRDPSALDAVLAFRPDVVVTAAYGQILPKALLEAPPWGCLNVHASLLPKYRGGAPIHRAILNGETETGVTIMTMVEALDAGDILSQVRVPIERTDTAGTLHDKLARAGAELLVDTLPRWLRGEIQPIPQDHAQATYAPNLTRDDERIDWTASAEGVYNRVRGLHPHPGAYTTVAGQVLKVWWGTPRPGRAEAPPGTVVAVEERAVVVATGDGLFALEEVQPAGKTRMAVEHYLRGAGRGVLMVGTRLGAETE